MNFKELLFQELNSEAKPKESELVLLLDKEDGWERFLKTVGPSTFTHPFAYFHQDFWNWYWKLTKMRKNGESLSKETLTFLAAWARGLGKSSLVEWACIVEGAMGLPGYVLYVSATQTSANNHVAEIRKRLESSAIAKHFPGLANPKIGKFGNRYGWREDLMVTESGWAIRPVGLDVATRGFKEGELRPSLICHEKGTEIYDGKWMLVEEHPTAQERVESGKIVNVHGLPFSETVTNEHRYWVRRIYRKSQHIAGTSNDTRTITVFDEPGWCEAQNLTDRHWIGTPIDDSLTGFEPIVITKSKEITERNSQGQIVKYEEKDVVGIPEEFSDPEWWWLFGLWWGDGHLGGKYQVCITIADKDTAVFERVKALLSAYKIKYCTTQRVGCFQLTFSCAKFNRWLRTWRYGNACKQPPAWVENIDLRYQQALIQGYIAADGWVQRREIRLTSVYLKGLLCVKRILARLGIASSIRKGVGPSDITICGVPCKARQKYDLRFQSSLLGLPCADQERYSYNRVFVENGWLWHKVRSVTDSEVTTFVPITTESREYLTHFGKSHNCLDDVDSHEMTLAQVMSNLETISRSILPSGTKDTIHLVAQNLIADHCAVNQIYTGASDILADHVPSMVKAFDELEVDTSINETTGRTTHKIKNAIPTWDGMDVDAAQIFLNKTGLEAFYAEYQHDFSLDQTEKVIPEYLDWPAHVITWSQFEEKFHTRNRVPTHWQIGLGLDIGYTADHLTAWTWIAVAAEDSFLPYAHFCFRGKTYTGTNFDEQIEEIKDITNYTVAGVPYDEREQYTVSVMSHEKLGERMLLNRVNGFNFAECQFKKESGVPQWRSLLRIDKKQPHPFHRDNKLESGLWEIGRPNFFYVVADGQERVPRDDYGLAIHRAQTKEWKRRKVVLTNSGVQDAIPMKLQDDACAVYSTLIRTRKGDIPIGEVVPGDEVLTRFGYRKVLRSHQTGILPVYEVVIGGRTLIATDNHKLVLARGKDYLGNLRIGDKVVCMKSSSLTESGITGTQSQSDGLLETIFKPMLPVGSKAAALCTSIYGKLRTELCPLATRFTTKTKTHSTILWKIWNVYLQKATKTYTRPGFLMMQPDNASPLQVNWPAGLDGNLDFENNTIKKKQKELQLTEQNKELGNVKFVKKSSPGTGDPIAQKGAEAEINLKERSSLGNVMGAIRLWMSEKICDTGTVLCNVETKPRFVGVQPVYNLSIEEHHEYFANGILSRNCDSTRMILAEEYLSSTPLTTDQIMRHAMQERLRRDNLDMPYGQADFQGIMMGRQMMFRAIEKEKKEEIERIAGVVQHVLKPPTIRRR